MVATYPTFLWRGSLGFKRKWERWRRRRAEVCFSCWIEARCIFRRWLRRRRRRSVWVWRERWKGTGRLIKSKRTIERAKGKASCNESCFGTGSTEEEENAVGHSCKSSNRYHERKSDYPEDQRYAASKSWATWVRFSASPSYHFNAGSWSPTFFAASPATWRKRIKSECRESRKHPFSPSGRGSCFEP